MQVNIDHIGYGENILVRDIAFGIAPGECLLLAGPNGSGKSTLLRSIAEKGAGASLRPSGRTAEAVSEGLIGREPQGDNRGAEPTSDSRGWAWVLEGIPTSDS